MNRKIEIDLEDFIQLLEQRRMHVNRVYNWEDQPEVWDWFIQKLREDKLHLETTNPMYIVDNLFVNGNYGPFDDFKNKNESDKEFMQREKENALAVLPKEKIIIYSLEHAGIHWKE
jgi:hypothetical protein